MEDPSGTEIPFPGTQNGTGDPDPDPRDEDLARIEILTLLVILIITLIGNLMVLAALYSRRHYRKQIKMSRMYYFILHLSIADLVTGVFNVLPQLWWDINYRFPGQSNWTCKLVKFVQPSGSFLSSYILMAIAIDRYRAICHPLTYHTWNSRRSRIMIMTAWSTAFTFCIPQITIFSYQEVKPGIYDCWASWDQEWGERAYVTWFSITVFIIPLFCLVYTYTCICVALWQNTTYPTTSPHKIISRAKINTIKQTIAVITLYIVCSLPFIFTQLWQTWNLNQTVYPVFQDNAVLTIIMLLSSLNSCVNPWIYLVSNRELIAALRTLCSNLRFSDDTELTMDTASASGSKECGRRTESDLTFLNRTSYSNPDENGALSDDCLTLRSRQWVVTVPENSSSMKMKLCPSMNSVKHNDLPRIYRFKSRQ
ncbi:oxytocin receptor [Diaphorina citri]|uniref:Oxytocin receptor n=1 Tax=Diaphorina citri TaxID=121845 RepID=A0A3Q0JHE7_DIACI|nr:oxytocin receptor [Diaphorina citri]